MKRYLFILTVLIGTVCEGQSITTDTLCFPVPTVRKLLIDAEQGKILKQQVVILNDRITLYQSMVRELESKDSVTVSSYEAQIKTMKEQRIIFEDQIKTYEKLLRREKLKRKLVTGAGILTTGIMIYLSSK